MRLEPDLKLAFLGRGYSWLWSISRLAPSVLAAHKVELFLLPGERRSASHPRRSWLDLR